MELRRAGADDTYDLFQSAYENDPDSLGEDIAQCLKQKGYCTLKSGILEEDLQSAASEAEDLRGRKLMPRPPSELLDGLLGEGCSAGMYEVEMQDPETASSNPTMLEQLDLRFFSVASQLAPWIPDCLSYEMSSRTPSVVLEAMESGEEPSPLTPPICWKWVHTFTWNRLMCILFLGPEMGTLELRPYDDTSGSFEIRTEPGMWVVLRADSLQHTFSAKGRSLAMVSFFMENQSDAPTRRKETSFPILPIVPALDAWLLDTLKEGKETAESQADFESTVTRELQSMANQVWHRGQQVAVRGFHGKWPGGAYEKDRFLSNLTGGCDTAECVPQMRWDNDKYYYTTPQDGFVVRDWLISKHVSLIDGIELFDNKFFGISIAEARGMDPLQRLCLEGTYETCLYAGFKKPQLMRNNIGVFTGGPSGIAMEWMFVPKDDVGGALGSTNGSCAILSNRLSFVFGLTGPNFLIDMDQSSAHMAVNMACDCVQPNKYQSERALALGIDLIMHPRVMMQLSWAGLMSPRGRNLTFDHTADGMIRSEGFGGMLVDPLLREIDHEWVVDDSGRERMGIISGTWAVNSGRTASLTAPSGASDQELLDGALRKADISPLDIEAVEVNADSQLLSDAVEVTALSRALRGKGQEEPVCLTAIKSNFGNSRPASGLCSVSRVLLSQRLGGQFSNQHLLRINPHMLLEEAPLHFPVEHVANNLNTNFTGITGKGYGGNCVHLIFWARVDYNQVAPPKTMVKHEPIVYWPGGGGELANEAVPLKYYTIVGSFNEWQSPEPMEPEGKGVYSYTITMSHHLVEKFQIWLDGDQDKVLHPGMTAGYKDSVVRGPDKTDKAEGMYWMIDAATRPLAADALQISDGTREGMAAVKDSAEAEAKPVDYYLVGLRDQGKPGFQYKVQLKINGRYRDITWEKVLETKPREDPVPVLAPVPSSKYYVVGSWTGWLFQEMNDTDVDGVFSLDVHVTVGYSQFYIVRNMDWHQMIYPSYKYADSDAQVVGPDEFGTGYTWQLPCQTPGETYKIELSRTFDGCSVGMQLSWLSTGTREMLEEELEMIQMGRYCLVGTFDQYAERHPMEWDGSNFSAEVVVQVNKTVSFVILVDGDWNMVMHPKGHDVHCLDLDSNVLRGPSLNMEGLAWTIGSKGGEDGRFRVQLHMQGNRPQWVDWERP